MSDFKDFKEIMSRAFGGASCEAMSEEERLAISKSACDRKCATMNAQEGNLHIADGFDCRKCKNRGFSYEPSFYLNYYDVVQRMCDCHKVRNAIRRMKRSGLEDLVKECRFDNFKTEDGWQKSALETAKRYAENSDGKWLFIGGASGRGKTHLCTATAIALLKKGFEVKYMLWRDEARMLKAKVNDPDYYDIIEAYKTIDVLYIDDLFKTGKGDFRTRQRPTEADINLAFEIINNRAIRKKRTIISSESVMLDLLDIDEAICGRIKQMCGDFCINIGAENTKNYRLE